MIEKYLRLLQNLLPQGKVWNRGKYSLLTKLLTALAQEFCRVEQRAKDLIEEVDPNTTTELIDDWERITKLPDETTPENPTIEERRQQVVQKLSANQGQNPAFFVEIGEKLGFVITITEFSEKCFKAGHSKAGDKLTNEAWIFYFQVNAPSEAEASGTLERTIDKLKPAHTISIYVYGG